MPNNISYDEDLDLLATTQRNLGKPNFEEIAAELTDYIAMPILLRKENVDIQSGTHMQWDVMVAYDSGARHVGLFAPDVVTVGDVMKQAIVGFRNTTHNYAVERHELSMNRDPARIVSLTNVRRASCMLGLVSKAETTFWSKPDDVNDAVTPYGLPMYIVKWPTGTPTPGFTGTNPEGFPDGVADLDSDLYPDGWVNWAGRYEAVIDDDLLEKIREAMMKTGFKSPVKHPSADRVGRPRALYSGYNVIAGAKRVVRQQNEQLGMDLDYADGEIRIKRVEFTYVPFLDDDVSDPVYGVNWATFKFCILNGWLLKENGPSEQANSHNTLVTHIDLTHNLQGHNRRKGNFVLSKRSKTNSLT